MAGAIAASMLQVAALFVPRVALGLPQRFTRQASLVGRRASSADPLSGGKPTGQRGQTTLQDDFDGRPEQSNGKVSDQLLQGVQDEKLKQFLLGENAELIDLEPQPTETGSDAGAVDAVLEKNKEILEEVTDVNSDIEIIEASVLPSTQASVRDIVDAEEVVISDESDVSLDELEVQEDAEEMAAAVSGVSQEDSQDSKEEADSEEEKEEEEEQGLEYAPWPKGWKGSQSEEKGQAAAEEGEKDEVQKPAPAMPLGNLGDYDAEARYLLSWMKPKPADLPPPTAPQKEEHKALQKLEQAAWQQREEELAKKKSVVQAPAPAVSKEERLSERAPQQMDKKSDAETVEENVLEAIPKEQEKQEEEKREQERSTARTEVVQLEVQDLQEASEELITPEVIPETDDSVAAAAPPQFDTLPQQAEAPPAEKSANSDMQKLLLSITVRGEMPLTVWKKEEVSLAVRQDVQKVFTNHIAAIRKQLMRKVLAEQRAAALEKKVEKLQQTKQQRESMLKDIASALGIGGFAGIFLNFMGIGEIFSAVKSRIQKLRRRRQ